MCQSPNNSNILHLFLKTIGLKDITSILLEFKLNTFTCITLKVFVRNYFFSIIIYLFLASWIADAEGKGQLVVRTPPVYIFLIIVKTLPFKTPPLRSQAFAQLCAVQKLRL